MIFSNIEQCAKIAKNIEKPMVFHLFSRFWGGSGVRKIKKNDENLFRESKGKQK